jgi:WD40 repeat protein
MRPVVLLGFFILVFLCAVSSTQALKMEWGYETGTTNEISDVAMNADGSIIALANGYLTVLSRDQKYLWGHRRAESISLTADGEYLASASVNDACLYTIDGTVLWCKDDLIPGTKGVQITSGGEYVIVGVYSSGYFYYFSNNGTTLLGKSMGGAPIYEMSAPDSGDYVVFVAEKELFNSFSKTGKKRFQYDKSDIPSIHAFRVKASDDGKSILVTEDYGNQGKVLYFDSGGVQHWELITNGLPRKVAASEDMSRIVVGDWDLINRTSGNIYFLDETGQVLWRRHFVRQVTDVALSLDGSQVAVGTRDSNLYLFDSTGSLSGSYTFDSIPIRLEFSGDGSTLAVGTNRGALYVFSTLPDLALFPGYDENITDSHVWHYSIPVFLTESQGYSRSNQPVVLSLSDVFGLNFSYTTINPYSIRVVDEQSPLDEPYEFGGNDTPSHLIDTNGDGIYSGADDLVFLSNVEANSTKLYFVYYSTDPGIGMRSYPPIIYNRVPNPGFETGEEGDAYAWSDFGLGYRRVADPVRSGDHSIQLLSSRNNVKYGATTKVTFPTRMEGAVESVRLSGWAKTLNLSDGPKKNFSLYMDVYYRDGGRLFGQTVPFSSGSHDWEYGQSIIPLNADVDFVSIYCYSVNRTGSAWFDDISLIENPYTILTGKIEPVDISNIPTMTMPPFIPSTTQPTTAVISTTPAAPQPEYLACIALLTVGWLGLRRRR